jgi:hypothetical protein
MSDKENVLVTNAAVLGSTGLFVAIASKCKAFASFNIIFDITQAIGFVVDQIDPYNYSQTMTREFVDRISKNAVDAYGQALQDPGIQKQFRDKLSSTYPSLTDEQKEVTISNQLSLYSEFFLTPYSLDQCFEGLYKFDPSNGPMTTGPPLPGCNLTYSNAYLEYYGSNKEIYMANNIKTSERIVSGVNNINQKLINFEVNRVHDQYMISIWILIGAVSAVLISVSIAYGLGKKKPIQ